MDEPIILANADGNRYAAAMVQAWADNHRGFLASDNPVIG